MSSFYLIIALVFSIIIALVAVANTDTVTVNYIFGRSSVSLIVLILGSAFAGALVMGMFSLFRSIKSAFAFRQARHEKEILQKKIEDLEEEKLFLQAELNKAISVPEEAVDSSRDAGEQVESNLDPDLWPGRAPGDEEDKLGYGKTGDDEGDSAANPYDPDPQEGDERPS